MLLSMCVFQCVYVCVFVHNCAFTFPKVCVVALHLWHSGDYSQSVCLLLKVLTVRPAAD